MLRKSVAANPAKTALVQGERRITYQELEQAASRFAGMLANAGVIAGDTVAVVLPNCPEFVICFFAIARVRAIMLPLNPAYTAEELRRFLTDRPAKIVVTDRAHESHCKSAAGSAAIWTIEEGSSADPLPASAEQFKGDALYLYTSGSTDSYKRVCCTQENLYFEAHNFVESAALTANHTILCTIPLFHSYGLGNCLLDAAYLGATLVLEPESKLPFAARHESVLTLLKQENIRFYPGVPFQFDVLSNSTSDVRAAFADLQMCVSSGDVLPQRTFNHFLSRTGHPIRSLYGSTEAGSIAMDTSEPENVRFGSLGFPLRNVSIEVRGPEGQIWVKSPVIPPNGYDNRPETNAAVFQEGFYNTGDIGKFDESGRLVMTGRKQTFFNVGGHKVDLAEVEEVLLCVPDVREAAAVGLEIPNLGGIIKAVVSADENCVEAHVLYHCRKHLAPYKVPRFVEFRKTLPRSPLGKILRTELMDPLSCVAEVPSMSDLPAAPFSQQLDWVAERIQEQAAEILRCKPSEILLSVPFQTLGFDSLRAVELQQRLSRMSGVTLSITTLWNYPSINEFASYLLRLVTRPALSTKEIEPEDTGNLSHDEVAAMLAAELNLTELAGS